VDPVTGTVAQAALKRRHLLVGSLAVMSGGTSVGCTSKAARSGRPAGPTSSPQCPPWECLQQPRLAAAAGLLAGRPGVLGILVRDRRTGGVWRAGRPDYLTWAASTVKLAIAVDLVERSRTGEVALDAAAGSQIADMLTASDDAAATSLWNRYRGESMVSRFRGTYGMARLAFGAGLPRTWSSLRCSTDDLAALMSYVLDRLDPDDRAYLVDTMRAVAPVQRWGAWSAGEPAQPGTTNGWAIGPDSAKRPVTNTVGFAGPEQRHVIAAMYEAPAGQPLGAGVHLVSDLVATVFGATVPAPVTAP
jgi:hypothetical protein